MLGSIQGIHIWPAGHLWEMAQQRYSPCCHRNLPCAAALLPQGLQNLCRQPSISFTGRPSSAVSNLAGNHNVWPRFKCGSVEIEQRSISQLVAVLHHHIWRRRPLAIRRWGNVQPACLAIVPTICAPRERESPTSSTYRQNMEDDWFCCCLQSARRDLTVVVLLGRNVYWTALWSPLWSPQCSSWDSVFLGLLSHWPRMSRHTPSLSLVSPSVMEMLRQVQIWPHQKVTKEKRVYHYMTMCVLLHHYVFVYI